MTQYLLGEASERESEQLESGYFDDDDAFEQMLIAEEELIDAYARGELSPERKQRFEKLFLGSAQGRERVQFARMLADTTPDAQPRQAVTAEHKDPSRPSFFAVLRLQSAALRFALVAAALAVAFGIPWLLFERARMNTELRELRAERASLRDKAEELERRVEAEQTQIAELRQRLEGAQAPTVPGGEQRADATKQPDHPAAGDSRVQTQRPSILSYALTPGLVRGGGDRTLYIPRGAAGVILRLNIETGAHASYRAVIETAGGREVWRNDSVKPRRMTPAGGILTLPAVPARHLPPNDYVLLLSGKRADGSFESVADYTFRVTSN